jgi:hypothetical protein
MSGTAPVRTSRYGAWIPAVVLILVGLIFLAQNYFGRDIKNWWALFIFIPVVLTLTRAYVSLQAGKTAEAFGQIIGGLVLVVVIVFFLFGLSFGQLWPIFLVIGGFLLLISRRSWRS